MLLGGAIAHGQILRTRVRHCGWARAVVPLLDAVDAAAAQQARDDLSASAKKSRKAIELVEGMLTKLGV